MWCLHLFSIKWTLLTKISSESISQFIGIELRIEPYHVKRNWIWMRHFRAVSIFSISTLFQSLRMNRNDVESNELLGWACEFWCRSSLSPWIYEIQWYKKRTGFSVLWLDYFTQWLAIPNSYSFAFSPIVALVRQVHAFMAKWHCSPQKCRIQVAITFKSSTIWSCKRNTANNWRWSQRMGFECVGGSCVIAFWLNGNEFRSKKRQPI